MPALKPRPKLKRALIQVLILNVLAIAGVAIFLNLPPSTINHIATTVSKNQCQPMNGTDTVTEPKILLGNAFSCLAGGRNHEAARNAILADAYISFDQQRLQPDPGEKYLDTGTRWFTALLNDEQRAQLSASKESLKKDPKAWQAFCGELQRLGPPAYYPGYLYRIGPNKPGKELSGPRLKKDFDPKQTWARILKDEWSCKT